MVNDDDGRCTIWTRRLTLLDVFKAMEQRNTEIGHHGREVQRPTCCQNHRFHAKNDQIEDQLPSRLVLYLTTMVTNLSVSSLHGFVHIGKSPTM